MRSATSSIAAANRVVHLDQNRDVKRPHPDSTIGYGMGVGEKLVHQ
jgi:hypothetical protein